MADKVRDIIHDKDESVISRSEEKLRRQKIQNRREEAEQRKKNLILDKELARQAKTREIEITKQSQIDKINDAVVQQQHNRIDTVTKAIDILSTAYSDRLIDEADSVIQKIESGAAGMNKKQLEGELQNLMGTLAQQDHGVPELAANLKKIVGETYEEQLSELNDNSDTTLKVIELDDLQEDEISEIIEALRSESRVTHKIRMLKKFGFTKISARKIIEEHFPDIKLTTFSFTWSKLEENDD